MAENITENEQEQYDLFEDRQAQSLRLLRTSVGRVGLTRIASIVGRDPSTISHALSGLDPGKRPSADVMIGCFLLDAQLRRDLCGLCGESVSRVPDLSPDDVIREVGVLAVAGEFGNSGRERVLALMSRLRK